MINRMKTGARSDKNGRGIPAKLLKIDLVSLKMPQN